MKTKYSNVVTELTSNGSNRSAVQKCRRDVTESLVMCPCSIIRASSCATRLEADGVTVTAAAVAVGVMAVMCVQVALH